MNSAATETRSFNHLRAQTSALDLSADAVEYFQRASWFQSSASSKERLQLLLQFKFMLNTFHRNVSLPLPLITNKTNNFYVLCLKLANKQKKKEPEFHLAVLLSLSRKTAPRQAYAAIAPKRVISQQSPSNASMLPVAQMLSTRNLLHREIILH